MRWPISVPKIDANVTRATVVEWLVREGERVEVGTPLVELETEKAVYTVEAEQSGMIGGIAVNVGEKVPVGTNLAFVDDEQTSDSQWPVPVRIRSAEDRRQSSHYEPEPIPKTSVGGAARAEARGSQDQRDTLLDEYAIDDFSEALFDSPSARASGVIGSKVAATLASDQTSVDDRGVLVVGAGRHAIEVIDALQARGVAIHGCLDARVPVGKEIYPGVRVVGLDRELAAMIRDGFRTVYMGIGGFDNLDVRIRLFSLVEELGVAAPPLIHPSAHVAPSSELGAGTTVLAHASVGPMNRIGRNCVITQNAVVSHHCCIGDNVVLSPNAALAAGVVVEDDATIGMGVTVYHDVHIGQRAIIVSGIHVFADAPAGATLKRDLTPAAHLRTACRAS